MTAKTRNALPNSDFAGPNRSFPENDKKHARLALSGSTRSYNAGNISAGTKAKIDARAHRLLGVNNLKKPKR